MKCSDAIIKLLLSKNINVCFELIGGMITHLIDSMYSTDKFQIISMHHEQSAAFAAEGYARAQGELSMAVAMGTSGPGATNLITGIGSCWFDSIPALFITGQVNVNELRGDRAVRQQGFQELDITQLVNPITKAAIQIKDVKDVLPALHNAIETALSGRRGPVLVDIPNNIQREDIDSEVVDYWCNKTINPNPNPNHDNLRQINLDLEYLCHQSRAPLICIGGGVYSSLNFRGWLSCLQKKTRIPYVSTLMGQKELEQTDSYYGMIGSYGNRAANWAVQNCDLLIVLGARLDVRQTGSDTDDFARNAKVVQIDIDPAQLNNRVKSDLAIHVDLNDFFKHCILTDSMFSVFDSKWILRLNEVKKATDIDEYSNLTLSPYHIFNALNIYNKNKMVNYVCDVGNNQMWAANLLRLSRGQTLHHSGGMGAMGFALPAAIGISLKTNERTIVIAGDGGIQINIQEFNTIFRLNLDIVIIILNNQSLGMVKNFQDMYFNGRDRSTKVGYSAPCFVEIGMSYGIQSRRVDSASQFIDALDYADEICGPYLIEVIVRDATECKPRLAFGSKLDNQYPALN